MAASGKTTADPRTAIHSHKGGRTQRTTVRITPEVQAALAEIKAKHGLSAADLLEWATGEWLKKLRD